MVVEIINKMNYPKVSIIIVNWNGLKDTIECLESLEKLAYQNFEMILVDNGSTDGSQKAIKNRFPGVKLIENKENLGFAGGVNEGIKYVSGEYVAFLNNDTIVDQNWLDELINPFLTMDGKIGATNSTIINYYNRNEIEYGGNGKLNIFGQTWASNKIEYDISEVHTISGASFMMKKEAIDRLEEFLCPEYFAYYEEIDLSWRLINLGYKLLYAPKSIVYHKGGMTSKEIPDKMHVNKVRNKYLTFYRNLPKSKFLLSFPILLFFDIISVLVLIFYARKIRNARLRLKGIKEFFKLKKEVKWYGRGKISFLDKYIFWDRLYI